MAIRLSKKGWNNVLIFSCMFMILLFNYTSNMFASNSVKTSIQPLVESSQLIQAIDFSGIEIQRLGATWRVLSKIPTANITQPKEFIETWSKQPLEQIERSPMVLDSAISIPVVVWLSGKSEGQIYEFVIDHQEQSVYIHDKTKDVWFALKYSQLYQFIPREIVDA
ncbi:hypothetical protein [Psychrosphaera aestuarii]|uniref:hypothetical protein n=1 Tax=Psychrosphaera aestuarii TaxID=1266052 RepID=UPI001B336FEE|nr:hypothetical protein [Psychrosphaera aestuarii]